MKVALIGLPPHSLQEPPLGVACLKAYLSKFGVEVKNYDLNIEMFKDGFLDKEFWYPPSNTYWWDYPDFEKIKEKVINYTRIFAKEITKINYDVIGLSIMTFASKNFALFISKILKEFNKDTLIVVGGTACLRWFNGYELINSEDIDFLVMGEGEETLKNIVINLEKGANKDDINLKGCLVKRNGRTIDHGDAILVDNLDDLPPPDFSDFKFKDYTGNSVPIESSRSCVNRCLFCNEHLIFKFYRSKSPEHLLNEIKTQIDRYGIRDFNFKDSLLNGNIENLRKFCELVLKSGLNFSWGGQGIIRKGMDKDLFKKMELAGFTGMCFGIESGSQKILNRMGKNYSINSAYKILESCHNSRIHTAINLIVGYPDETIDDFIETLEFVRREKESVDEISEIGMCHLIENSYLTNNHEKFGIENVSIDNWYTKDGSNNYKIRYIKLLILKWFLKKLDFRLNVSLNMEEYSLILDKNLNLIDKIISNNENLETKEIYKRIKTLLEREILECQLEKNKNEEEFRKKVSYENVINLCDLV